MRRKELRLGEKVVKKKSMQLERVHSFPMEKKTISRHISRPGGTPT